VSTGVLERLAEAVKALQVFRDSVAGGTPRVNSACERGQKSDRRGAGEAPMTEGNELEDTGKATSAHQDAGRRRLLSDVAAEADEAAVAC
jgi:hypothetical protein